VVDSKRSRPQNLLQLFSYFLVLYEVSPLGGGRPKINSLSKMSVRSDQLPDVFKRVNRRLTGHGGKVIEKLVQCLSAL